MDTLQKILTGCLILVSVCTNAQNNEVEKRGIDITPNEIRDKFLTWGKPEYEEKSGLVRMSLSRADTWQYAYSLPVGGYLLPKKGERITGKIILHKRWNKESKIETVEDVRIIRTDGTDALLSTNDVILYGINFTSKDWLPDKYLSATVQFEYAPAREGLVMLGSNMEQPYPELHYYSNIFFAKDKTALVEMLYPKGGIISDLPQVTQVGQVAGGKNVVYSLFNASLIDRELWVNKLDTDPKKMKVDPLSTGEMLNKNGTTLKGRFAFNSGNKKSYAFFVDAAHDVYQVTPWMRGIRVIRITPTTGSTIQFVPMKGRFVNSDLMISDFEKDKKLLKSHLVLTNGTELDGVSSFETAQNVIKSYRVPLSVYFVSGGKDSFVEQFWPNEIKTIEQVIDGKPTQYVPLTQKGFRSFVKLEEYLKALESENFKDPTRNLQKGYMVLNDGQKMEGRIAQGNAQFTFVGGGNQLEIYTAVNPLFKYFVQSVDGVDRKFISLEHGIRAFSGPGYELTEVLQPFGTYSYYRNPMPTHLKKGLTNFVKGTINTATDAGRAALANEVAEEEVKEELQNSDGGADAVSSAVEAGAESQAETLEMTEGMIEVSDEGGIYHKEWVIVNNTSGEMWVVYKGNDEEVLSGLMQGCSKFQSLPKKEVRQLTNINNMENIIKFLNGCSP